MVHRVVTVSGVLLALGLAACGEPKAKQITEPTEKPSVSLADIRAQVGSDEVRTTEAPEIDSAAKNINPFKAEYNYLERDAYNALIMQASEEEGYLERSMQATIESLSGLPGGITANVYEDAIGCAAIMDVAARTGLMSAHAAQDAAEAFIFDGVLAPAFEDGADMPREINGESVPLSVREDRAADFRKRTYLNYFLTRDAFYSAYEETEISARMASCVPSDDTLPEAAAPATDVSDTTEETQ